MFHDWGNNTTTIQQADTIKTIHVIKKLVAPTKCPELLVCYFFILEYQKEDLMFVTEPKLFSIETIAFRTLV
jgi:hypothetical protein